MGIHSEVTYDWQTGGLEDQRQLEGNVGEHIVVLGEFRMRRVEVESGAGTKVPISVFAVDTGPSWRGVREKKSDSFGGGSAKESALLRAVVLGARQTGEVYKQGDLA